MTTMFTDFALEPALQESLASMNFSEPTPIQAMAIPLALEGRDLLGSAQTGTGKTGAFCVPMINYLIQNPTAHALVMLPTRELATQVHDVARKMIGEQGKGQQGIKTALLIGGEPIGKQYAQLSRRPRLIVGTPGRINDHLRGNPDLVERVSFVVLDEADRMLDMGFAPQIDSILSETALERQTLMFSATFPDNIVKFSKQYLQNPERISAGTQSKPGENIVQENMDVDQSRKYDELLSQLQKREGSVIVFVRTQHSADKIAQRLNNDDHAAEAIHGGLRQRQREKVISMFRKSAVRVLVATDVAARGLDVPHIEHVVNYDLPQVAEDYIHRIGRTARAGNKGHAISFISSGERHLWRDIDRMMNPESKGAYESTMREGGPKKSGGKFGYGKKTFGQKPYGKKPFDGERSGGGFKERKPFGRADRKDRKEGGWNPANDFQRSEGGEQRGERNYANNPDSYKRTSSTEGRTFKKSFGGDRPFRKEGGNNEGRSFKPRSEGGYNDRSRNEGGERSYKPRSEGGYNDRPRSNNGDRPFRSDKPRSEGGYDRPRSNNGDRPFRKEGSSQGQRDGGFKPRSEGNFKPRSEGGYNDRPRSGEPRKEGGFKKPYASKDGAKRSEGGFKKSFNRDGKKEGGERSFRKPDGARPARKAY